MFFACLAATFVLRPLRDQFGVDRGVDQLPYLYSLTLLATVFVVLRTVCTSLDPLTSNSDSMFWT